MNLQKRVTIQNFYWFLAVDNLFLVMYLVCGIYGYVSFPHHALTRYLIKMFVRTEIPLRMLRRLRKGVIIQDSRENGILMSGTFKVPFSGANP